MVERVAIALVCLLAVVACAGSPPAAGLTPAPTPVIPVPEPDAGPVDSSPGEDAPAPTRLPDQLEIELEDVGNLSLIEILMKGKKRGSGIVFLEGVVNVKISNPSDVPVKLVHMDPANLVFTRLDTAEHFSMLHPCDPGLLLGSVVDSGKMAGEDDLRILSNSVFELGPGESRVFEMGEEWGCSGGPWKPVPKPGEYTVEYRIHPWRPQRKPAVDLPQESGIHKRLDAARKALASREFWHGAYRSNPVRVKFGNPRVRRLDY